MGKARFVVKDRSDKPHPPGNTPHWFTRLEDGPRGFLKLEQDLLAEGLIPAPFNFDPCAHLDAPVSQLIMEREGHIWPAPDLDGLTSRLEPEDVAFVNPPGYTEDSMPPWLRWIEENDAAHRVLYANAATSTEWWRWFVEPILHGLQGFHDKSYVRFLRGRSRFGFPGSPEGKGGTTPTFGQVVVVWQPGDAARVAAWRKANDWPAFGSM